MVEDAILIQVNGTEVFLRDVIRQMGVADNLRFFDEFARRELIRQLALREGVCAAPEDIQRKVDEWRYQHRLEQVEDTEVYLIKRGITLQDVAEDAEVRRLEFLLSEKIAEGKVEPYFAQHTLAFDEAEVCWIFHTDEGVIDEVDLQITRRWCRFLRDGASVFSRCTYAIR